MTVLHDGPQAILDRRAYEKRGLSRAGRGGGEDLLPQALLFQIQKRHSSGSMDDRLSLSARDYVESLHQNSRATLLYGKNNVRVQPVSSAGTPEREGAGGG